MAKKPDLFNNPFGGVKLQPAQAPRKHQAPKRAEPVARPHTAAEDDEAALFRRAIGGVEKIVKGPPLVTSGPPSSDASRLRAEDEEALAALALLVDLPQGHGAGLDPRIVKRLRAGEYPVQGRLDLHGMLQAEAKPAVERFIAASRRAGKKCVLVVHGRGLNSPGNVSVLKEGVPLWLSHGPAARDVLAFCSARPRDGGAGALYVLLRR